MINSAAGLRYSVDARWLVPHLKMLTITQLAQLYLDAYLVSGEGHHAETVRDILDYVQRDYDASRSGFYSAEDADSEVRKESSIAGRTMVSKLLAGRIQCDRALLRHHKGRELH